jgi:hypothetical protein
MGEHIPYSGVDDCQECGAETVPTGSPNLRRCPACGASLGAFCLTGTPLLAAGRKPWAWRFLEWLVPPPLAGR